MEYPDRYVITGIVKEGDRKGQKVWLYWSPEGGGWWQWSSHASWAMRFESKDGARYEDAIRCARGTKWLENGCGPWYYYVDFDTVDTESVPAIVEVR